MTNRQHMFADTEQAFMEFGSRAATPNVATAGDVIKDATSASFATDVIEASRTTPVIVDFWAPWCGPCKQLTPVLEKVVRSHNGKVRLVKINVDENQAIAAQLQIQSLPTVYAFHDGRPLDGFAGVQPESAIKAFVNRLIAEDATDALGEVLATGDDLLEQGDLQGAVEVYAAVLQEDNGNADALAGLAQCYIKSGDLERAKQTIQLVAPERRNDQKVQSVLAIIELAEKAPKSGVLDDLRTRLSSNPKDHQARFDLAVGLAAVDEKAEALDLLLDLVRLDRKWNEEAARKQLLQFFDAWGAKEPLVNEGRRRLSSILFS